MSLAFEERGGATVVRLSGRLTLGPALEDLRNSVEALLADGRSAIVLDLDELSYIESAGLGEIVACRRLVREGGGRLVLARPRGKVRDVVQLTRIDQLIETFSGLDEALRAVCAG